MFVWMRAANWACAAGSDEGELGHRLVYFLRVLALTIEARLFPVREPKGPLDGRGSLKYYSTALYRGQTVRGAAIPRPARALPALDER